MVVNGTAPEALLDTYAREREVAADENILNSTRATDFITPKSEISKIFRNAVLDLAEHAAFARPIVNSGRLSLPCTYDLDGADDALLPRRTRPGSPVPDVPLDEEWLLSKLGGQFLVLAIDAEIPDRIEFAGLKVNTIKLSAVDNHALRERFLGDALSAVYLLRPDQHVAARWLSYDEMAMQQAIRHTLAML
jgi:3-(3-hydroxy-phenyl)propionate hydroxylase